MGARFDRLGKKIFGDDSTHEVPNKELFRYSLGIAGQNQAYVLISSWFLYYCTDVLYLNPLVLGTILAVSRVWDAVNDPIVGAIIDKRTFKNGEKLRPYLKIMSIPIGIMVMMLFIDFGFPTYISYIYIVAIYFVFDMLYSFQDVAQWGLTALMATSSKERERVSHIGRLGAMIGSTIGGSVAIFIANHEAMGISEKTLFVIFGVVFGFGGMALSLFAASARERAPVIKVEGGLKESFNLLMKNKMVMLIVLGSVLGSCTLTMPQIYFFKYMVSLEIFGKTLNGMNVNLIFGIAVGLPGTFCMFFANRLAKALGGMKNILIFAVISGIVCRLAAFAIGFEGYRIILVALLLALADIPSRMMGIAMTALWGDSLDYMEWKTGQRNEGSVFAMQNFTSKLTNSLNTFFTGVTLALLQFDSKLYEENLPQPPVFTKWAWPIFILAPAFGCLLHLIPLLLIKYGKEQRAVVEEKLRHMRGIKDGTIVPAYAVCGNSLRDKIVPPQIRRIMKKAAFPVRMTREADIDW